ncbi:MAG: hypothetical protein IT532_17585 [Burkholderiales bacterium]|nr:hypothetical protein [Burkholderiales bacterium]
MSAAGADGITVFLMPVLTALSAGARITVGNGTLARDVMPPDRSSIRPDHPIHAPRPFTIRF